MAITPRERVLMAVAHEEPDRVPLSLWGSWYGVTDKLYFSVMDELGWEPAPPFRPDRVHSVNYYDDRLLERLHVDVRHVDSGAIAAYSRTGPDGTDGLGMKWDTSGLYRSASHHPLANASVDEIMAYPLPDPNELVDAEGVRARLRAIKALDQEYAIVGRSVASYGFFEMAQSLRRHEQVFLDLVRAPDVINAFTQRLYGFYAAMIVNFLDVAGPELDILELPGDDFAGNAGPIISPKMFTRYFKDAYTGLVKLVNEHSPHIKTVYHSDGAMTAFLPQIVETGADIFHSMEPLPAWDLAEMKAKYGDKITFMGAIDIKEALRGSREDVVAEVKLRLAELGAGGGYILAPSNHVQWDVPVENLFTLYDAAEKYGRYPLAWELEVEG